ncbi:M15 family metallopeptidase [Geminocystis herdmanii]|uniref:M15 family metallopeptidase n=1 Tax=Geminocystis herdmanii TaxID=669359 RepID=UPI0036F23BD0
MKSMDEIPVALRELQKTPSKGNRSIEPKILIIGIIGATVGLLAVVLLLFNNGDSAPSPQVNNTPTTEEEVVTSPDESTPPPPNEEAIPDNILGHLAYEEAPQSELKPITRDGAIRLREKAADKFLQMQRDARAQGIILTPISGFRSISDQEYLFFKIKEQRKQPTSKRAEVSAPPGYSEHHTGYAVDIGDGNAPATNLNTNFEQTPAYKWLSQNAAKYSFELSFTPDNLQGISYEPWHWRFVGDTHSLETFYKARQLTNKL